MSRQMYAGDMIDFQKTIEDAAKKSHTGTVIVHKHSVTEHCGDDKHYRYERGVLTDEWGRDGQGAYTDGD